MQPACPPVAQHDSYQGLRWICISRLTLSLPQIDSARKQAFKLKCNHQRLGVMSCSWTCIIIAACHADTAGSYRMIPSQRTAINNVLSLCNAGCHAGRRSWLRNRILMYPILTFWKKNYRHIFPDVGIYEFGAKSSHQLTRVEWRMDDGGWIIVSSCYLLGLGWIPNPQIPNHWSYGINGAMGRWVPNWSTVPAMNSFRMASMDSFRMMAIELLVVAIQKWLYIASKWLPSSALGWLWKLQNGHKYFIW